MDVYVIFLGLGRIVNSPERALGFLIIVHIVQYSLGLIVDEYALICHEKFSALLPAQCVMKFYRLLCC